MTRPSHAALVEEVTREVCLSKGDDWDEAVRLGCQHEYEPAARAILSLIAARLSDVTPEMVEVVADALSDAEFGYDLNLIRLVDGVSTYRLAYSDGTPPIEFDDMDEAYAHIAAKKRSAHARAAISAFLAASPLAAGTDSP